MENKEFLRLTSYFKTWLGIAKKLGVNRSYMVACKRRDGLPPLRAIQIERMTDGEFKAYELLTPQAKDQITYKE